jgi:hypothetical protein
MLAESSREKHQVPEGASIDHARCEVAQNQLNPRLEKNLIAEDVVWMVMAVRDVAAPLDMRENRHPRARGRAYSACAASGGDCLPSGEGDQLRSTLDIDLDRQVGDVPLDGSGRQVQASADLLVRQPFAEEA